MFEVLTPEVREILDRLTQQLQSQNKLLEMLRERMDRLEQRAKKRRKWKE
jgi:prefoldin subunit 5